VSACLSRTPQAAEHRPCGPDSDILEGLEDQMMAIGTAANDMLSEARKTAVSLSAAFY
jgi:hypothetical protein